MSLKNIETKFNDNIINQLDMRFKMKEKYRQKIISEYLEKFLSNPNI